MAAREAAGERRNAPGAEGRIADLLRAFRAAGAAVIHVRHDSVEPASRLRPGLAGYAPLDEGREAAGEPVLHKRASSAFIGTPFAAPPLGGSATPWHRGRQHPPPPRPDRRGTVPDQPADPARLFLRAARPSDFEAVAAISAMSNFRHGTLRLPWRSPDETRRYLENVGADDLALVAERDGTIVGSAGWSRAKGRRSHVAAIGMGVHDDHAGRGVGTALMAALVDAADSWYALRRLELAVYTDNVRAIALYRRFGFTDEGVAREDAFRDGHYVDTLRMARLRPAG